MKKRLEKGFTLIELMIVVAIIAILAAVAIPKFGAQVKKSRDSKALATLSGARSAAAIWLSDEETNGISWDDVKTKMASGADQILAKAGTALSSNVRDIDGTKLVDAYIVAGTAVTKTDDSKPAILVNGITTEGVIAIDSTSGKNTKGDDWDKF